MSAAARRQPTGVYINYELKYIRCGKARCYCMHTRDEGSWHGPYWYAFWNDPRTGKKRAKYMGKHFRPPTRSRPNVHSEHASAAPETGRRQRSTGAGRQQQQQQQQHQRRHHEAPPPRHGRADQYARDAALFGVPLEVNAGDLKRAWRQRIVDAHPDRYPEGAERRRQERVAQELNEAYQRMRRYRGWQ